MGDAADDLYLDQDLKLAMLFDDECRLVDDLRSGTWITRDGERIAVKDMTDRHLENALRFFGRADRTDLNDLRLEVLLEEQERRRAR